MCGFEVVVLRARPNESTSWATARKHEKIHNPKHVMVHSPSSPGWDQVLIMSLFVSDHKEMA